MMIFSLGILVGFLLWKRRLGLPYYVGWHQVNDCGDGGDGNSVDGDGGDGGGDGTSKNY